MKHFFHTLFSLKKLRLDFPRFIKVGLFVIATLLLTVIIADRITDGAVNSALANNVMSNSISFINEKKLPIYCVKTDKKQIALTFDGAWGDGGYGHKRKPFIYNAFYNLHYI